ncbi:extracellular ribonuclease [Candidatus Uabimicrobium amorphum]|uniref:Extracellular ribonuclease n=1 Tax=Uabimicrobium amorphum TaxID=2596890 RepID=A0A5S9F2Q3_UABAM|nr:endonuclease [Candidatus Uabimicrobium amorphum]BBM83917.1 extracellular ribonuclease [Candidatus Uabimicrobium amorphum]
MKQYLCIFVVLSLLPIWGQGDYYEGTTGLKGKALKSKLHQIISGHKSYSYGELWNHLAYTDADPSNANNVILFYTGWSRSKNAHGGGVSQWNREHTWAKSRGQFGTAQPAGTDLHHIRPTDVSVNSKRGHLDFDNGGEIYQDNDGLTECRYDKDSWEPRKAVKGDVARIIFYMATRYEGQEGNVPDLKVTDIIMVDTKKGFHGKLSTLLKWHKEDPVDYFERRRNERVYELQKNRNPFIDHPEFVDQIWNGSDPDPDPDPDALTVTQALQKAHDQKVIVEGVISGGFNGIYGLSIADSKSTLVIQLPSQYRQQFNPNLNPAASGKRVRIVGTRDLYASEEGIKKLESIEFIK